MIFWNIIFLINDINKKLCVDSVFSHDVFPLNGSDSLQKKSSFIFIYFFKGKQNKKENYKYDSLFRKTVRKKPIMSHRSKASHDNE